MQNIYQQYNAIYIHIPMCVQKCLYCDFASYSGFSQEDIQVYTNALCHEIKIRRKEAERTLSKATIYFGGGTPSLLPIDCLEKIIISLKENNFWHNDVETTIEVNPGTVDLDKLIAIRNLGFNRISFGVQSLQNIELKSIGRIHTAKQALEAIQMAKDAGFKRISCDVIYGLPKQTLTSLKDTLIRLTATGIEHISVYGLILEESTPLAKLVEQRKVSLPDEDLVADMYEFIQDFLADQGFIRYEISNYAKNNQYSRHNTIYWQYKPYLGFGSSACGFDGFKRRTATASVNIYNSIVKLNSNNWMNSDIYEIEDLTLLERLEEFMFMGLRQIKGADLAEAKLRYGIDVMDKFGKDLDFYIKNNYVIYDKKQEILKLTDKGMEIGNKIFEIFVIE